MTRTKKIKITMIMLFSLIAIIDAKNVFVADFDSSHFKNSFENGHEGRSEIIYDSLLQNHVLRLKYPKGCVGTGIQGSTPCAVQLHVPLETPGDTMWLSYKVFFEPGFDFRKGGKLPGFCGGKCYTGGKKPLVGDGWSARIMWRDEGKIEQYIYSIDQRSKYGESALWNLGGQNPQAQFETGKWNTLRTKLILNSVNEEGKGARNGIIQCWFNKDLVLSLDSIRFRDFSSVHIDQLYFSTFHGGSAPYWAPRTDSYTRFDDFVISKDSIAFTP